MPPKPQVFKTPDGKEFTSRAEWRDYMMATFYTFKNKVNETCIKKPGDIDGQMFDIGDCSNSNLIIMDNCEQVQIDVVTNSRVFVGACASSIFIRNCSNCVFYTCCRQLRLREVVNCTFYIYSMAEVHIEYSNNLQFAPFNGGYPEHAKHLRAANLDVSHNLWYDIFDHNDPGRTRVNWSLLPEANYEPEGWFPAGPCERAIAVTRAGSVTRTDENASSGSMQSFGMQQLIADAQAIASSPSKTKAANAPPAVPVAVAETAAAVPPPPAEPVATVATAPAIPSEHHATFSSLIASFAAAESVEQVTQLAGPEATVVVTDGSSIAFSAYAAAAKAQHVVNIDEIRILGCGKVALLTFVTASAVSGEVSRASAVVEDVNGSWKFSRVHFTAVAPK